MALAITAAMVGRDGSIDWLCWPRFGSAAGFAALPGTSENGRWLIAHKFTPLHVKRRYHPGTLILETEFRTEAASAVIGDANLVRIVFGRSGQVTFCTEIVVRFD
jgi:GH15 family glucan-1,4-alpha-glucosidase